jgi:hypothetical protein
MGLNRPRTSTSTSTAASPDATSASASASASACSVCLRSLVFAAVNHVSPDLNTLAPPRQSAHAPDAPDTAPDTASSTLLQNGPRLYNIRDYLGLGLGPVPSSPTAPPAPAERSMTAYARQFAQAYTSSASLPVHAHVLRYLQRHAAGVEPGWAWSCVYTGGSVPLAAKTAEVCYYVHCIKFTTISISF